MALGPFIATKFELAQFITRLFTLGLFFFILYYGAGYVNVLQLLMVAGYTIYMNMSIHNS